MATCSVTRLLWSYKAPLASALVVHNALSVNNNHVTACEKSPKNNNTKLQSRMTSIGHFSVLSETTHNPSIVTFVMALTGKTPLTTQEFAHLWRARGMEERHPRFHKKIDRTAYFVPTDDPVEEHLTESTFPAVPRADVKSRIQLLQTTPWDLSEKLWHMWIAPWGKLGASGLVEVDEEAVDDSDASTEDRKGESLLFFQAHHALGDGASMTAAFLDVLDEAAEIQQDIIDFLRKLRKRGKHARGVWRNLARKMKRILAFLLGSLRALLYQSTLMWHMLWETDPWVQIRKSTSTGEEKDAQRNISWSKAAPLEQVKWIAQQLSLEGKKMTVNDIFCACVSAAIAKQLSEHRNRIQAVSSDDVKSTKIVEQKHFNIAFPVHLKGGVVLPGESVGNNLGAFVVRVPGEVAGSSTSNSHERLLQVRDSLATVKSMPTAILSHILAKGFSYASAVLPTRFVGWMYSCSNGGSIAVISNNRGLPKTVHLGGRRVEAMYGFVPLPPGIPIGVVVMSYAGDVNLTITAEPWAVPDADQFLVWVLEEYTNLLRVAREKSSDAL